MKSKLGAAAALTCIVAVAACSPLTKSNYWKRVNYDSALYLKGPQAVEQLHHDIATCTNAVDKMSKTDTLRKALPQDPDARGGDPLPYYDSPGYIGDKKAEHSDFHDFEGCMYSMGWVRQDYVRPQTMQKSQNDYADTQSLRMTGLTREEKRAADLAAAQKRLNDLVKPGPEWGFGIDAYRDKYAEPDFGVNTQTTYWGATMSYTSRSLMHSFWGMDGRFAGGRMDYNSDSGFLHGVPEYEGELRLKYGHDYAWRESWLSPYFGLGVRSYRMSGKGRVTDLGFFGYDRRIDQLYLPIGVTWRSLIMDWAPVSGTLELDPLITGRVNSRLQNAGGPNVVNIQSPLSGAGLRGDLMFGLPVKGATWELGPYFRYWYMKDSEVQIVSCGGGFCLGFLRPLNTRLQLGLTLRVLFK